MQNPEHLSLTEPNTSYCWYFHMLLFLQTIGGLFGAMSVYFTLFWSLFFWIWLLMSSINIYLYIDIRSRIYISVQSSEVFRRAFKVNWWNNNRNVQTIYWRLFSMTMIWKFWGCQTILPVWTIIIILMGRVVKL